MTFYFVRHGETFWNVQNRMQGKRGSRLTNSGICQAKVLAKRFAKVPLVAVLTSPTVRTVHTAKLIAAPHRLIPIRHPALHERFHGVFEGVLIHHIERKFPGMNKREKAEGIDWRPPGGESLRETFHRTVNFLQSVVKKYGTQDVVIVTHGGILKCLMHFLQKRPVNNLNQTRSPHNCAVVKVRVAKKKGVWTPVGSGVVE